MPQIVFLVLQARKSMFYRSKLWFLSWSISEQASAQSPPSILPNIRLTTGRHSCRMMMFISTQRVSMHFRHPRSDVCNIQTRLCPYERDSLISPPCKHTSSIEKATFATLSPIVYPPRSPNIYSQIISNDSLNVRIRILGDRHIDTVVGMINKYSTSVPNCNVAMS